MFANSIFNSNGSVRWYSNFYLGSRYTMKELIHLGNIVAVAVEHWNIGFG